MIEKKPKPAVDAWSYSRLSLYELCPLKFKLQVIDKAPFVRSPAMIRGDAIHKIAASFLTSKGDEPVPPELKKFAKLFRELKALPDKVVELKWAFSKSWRKTAYFGPDTWLRVILDVGVLYEDDTGEVIDHKTGKKYDDNKDQMALFAAATFGYYPRLKKIKTRLWYLDIGDEEEMDFTAAEVPALRADFEKRAARMMQDPVYAARPNDKCVFCDFSKSKGGPCRFG